MSFESIYSSFFLQGIEKVVKIYWIKQPIDTNFPYGKRIYSGILFDLTYFDFCGINREAFTFFSEITAGS